MRKEAAFLAFTFSIILGISFIIEDNHNGIVIVLGVLLPATLGYVAGLVASEDDD